VLFDFEARFSTSPYVERIWRTRSERSGTFTSLAASQWELVVAHRDDEAKATVRGPETVATSAVCAGTGVEYVGIVFRLGAFMPHLPPGFVMNRRDVDLPAASGNSFWLGGAAWQAPSYENAETFVEWLVRDGLLVRDPLVEAAARGQLRDDCPRRVQRHFLRATGLTQRASRQIERAREAALLLRQRISIADTVFAVGYFDQAHLTRSLIRFIGQIPAKIVDPSRSLPMSLLYKTTPLGAEYAGKVDQTRPRETNRRHAQDCRLALDHA
jgi:AraC-like DNA-binding protein